ncbi:hypothetical protein BLX24_18955 [Arsenicibacter rosenii]|uniref:Uncharacterized protein n=2 Tax=Arsenicibacter rosenii TaxID=1750698 RepID=A0A1S2VH91_9BACT|nr:hypothetical protein BLX24_18955 [Arsenicibacter rosenii]
MNDSHPVTLNLVNRIISTTGKFENHRISASDVTEGIETALILRDENALAYLATIPVSFTEQSSQDDLILEIIMTFYQMLAKGKGNSNEAQATYHAISEQLDWETYKRYIKVEGFNQLWVWERIFTARKEYVEAISLPVITIYHQIFQASQAGFEDAVRLALHQWKTYYTRIRIDENQEEEDRTLWGQGFLSLPITAACAFGYERGLTLSSLESDYIPQWLIEGHFNGIDLLVK